MGHARGHGGRQRELRRTLSSLLPHSASGRRAGRVALMRVVALTGSVAAGKSTVGALFRAWGTTVIDADAMVRQLQQPGEPVFAAIVAAFGRDILRADGTLDRAALRSRILRDAA